jgi:hypothetical protein
MLALVRRARGEGCSHLEFMLHSSELMPGGSPEFPDEASIEALYSDLAQLFAEIKPHWAPRTLSEFRRSFGPVAPGIQAPAGLRTVACS